MFYTDNSLSIGRTPLIKLNRVTEGAHATIPFSWDEATQTLTIGDRAGTFPGMLETRTFRVVFVGENHGVGDGPTEHVDKIVRYSGTKTTVAP